MGKTIYIILIFTLISCKNKTQTLESTEDEITNDNLPIQSIIIDDTNRNDLMIIDPVKWTTETNKVSATEYELKFIANIENNYHLYSQESMENGPLPTIFIFEETDDYELIGNTSEEKGNTKFDPTFKLEVKFFKTKAIFRQMIKLKVEKSFKISAEIEFMSCDDSKCITGYSDVEFQI